MKKIVFLIFGILLYACCKEDIPPSNPLIGQWNIFRVDSGFGIVNLKKDYRFIKQLDYTGSFDFMDDGYGKLKGSIANITENEENFIWKYDTTYLPNIWLRFAFLSGTTYGMLDTLHADTASFYIRDFVFKPFIVGGGYYYHIQLVKQSSIK
jgi:hypothetical protein